MLFPPFYSFAIIVVDIITFLSLLFHGVGENKSFMYVVRFDVMQSNNSLAMSSHEINKIDSKEKTK